jgi:predicted lipoprotein with Yx(FWY)xxD motif
MKRAWTALAAVAAIALVGAAIAGCGGDDDSDGGEVAASEPAAGSEAKDGAGSGAKQDSKPAKDQESPGEQVELRDSEFGTILVDDEDETLYLFDKEASDASECYGDCAEAWPPYLTEGEPQAGKGVDQGLLGTTERDDGTSQVTYNGHPLYYYVDDPAGQVLCHNVEEFGGLWLVVTPEGNPVQ